MQLHWPGFHSLQKLSTEETAELAERVAELTKTGLPLGPGIHAMADELPGRRLRGVLDRLADQLDAGMDLVTALESQGQELPPHLRGLVLAGVRSGKLAEVLDEFVELQRSRLELCRRVLLCMVYPFILLLFITALAIFAAQFLVIPFESIFREFDTSLPGMTQWVINLTRPMMWFLVAFVILATIIPLGYWLLPGMQWLGILLNRLPVLGPLLRLGHLSQFSRLMAILLEQQTALPDALRVAAGGVQDVGLARGCRRVADEVEGGRMLSESMAARRAFPAGLIPLVRWGQNVPALSESFRAATEMFEGRIRTQSVFMETLLLPIMLFLVLFFVGFFIIAMFMPLISLLTRLSG